MDRVAHSVHIPVGSARRYDSNIVRRLQQSQRRLQKHSSFSELNFIESTEFLEDYFSNFHFQSY